MSHMVESLAYVSNEENQRFVPWHGIGTPVESAMTSAEALKVAGLDWKVEARPVFTDNGIKIPGYVANTRDSDNSVLGIVSDKYRIVQNVDAFAFTDSLIGEDCRYETAGSLRNGKSTFMLARLPQKKILGDDFENYICFTNTHDGTGAVKVCSTNVRVVCNNTLNLALNTAKRSWTCKHMGRIEDKLQEAQRALQLAEEYTEQLSIYAERAANITIDEAKTYEVLKQLFPISDDASDRMKKNNQDAINDFRNCLVAVDLSPFYGTLWGLVNAASDFAYHRTPTRMTSTYQEGKMNQAIHGCGLLDKVMELCPVSMD